MTELAYRVHDRSVLLPLYKRFVVEPTVRFVPARVAPNAITHAGHLIQLVAVTVLFTSGHGPYRALACTAAIVLTHLYNWCDNADGAHARRTNQCSAMGELLDHGLDILNATYIAAMAAYALGVPPLWALAMVLTVVAAAASTYWEQAESGMFQLGWLNQVESVVAVSILIGVHAIWGPEAFATRIGPMPIWLPLAGFTCANALFTIAQAPYRVWRRQGRVGTFVPVAALGAAVFAAAATGALAPSAAAAIGIAGYVFLGVRYLGTRLEKRRPEPEPGVLTAAAALFAVAGAHGLGVRPSVALDVVCASVAIAFFGSFAVRYGRLAIRAVRALDQARTPAVTAR